MADMTAEERAAKIYAHFFDDDDGVTNRRAMAAILQGITEAVAAERKARLKLEIEIEAAKAFGGGFYGDTVEEETRDIYRRNAAAAIEARSTDHEGKNDDIERT